MWDSSEDKTGEVQTGQNMHEEPRKPCKDCEQAIQANRFLKSFLIKGKRKTFIKITQAIQCEKYIGNYLQKRLEEGKPVRESLE